MKSKKITGENHSIDLKTSADSAVVRGKFFNDLKDDHDAINPADGVLKGDSVVEKTADAGVTIENILIKDGTLQHAIALSYHVPFISENIQQDLTTTFAGPNTAIENSTFCTAITSGVGGANAVTLAAPPITGILKKIILAVDAADVVVTVSGGTTATITLGDAGDYVVLIGTSAGWRCIENSGCVLT